MVFYHHEIAPAPDRLPRYLDLGYYAEQEGIPFTFSSNLLHALHAAVRRVNWEKRFAETAEWSAVAALAAGGNRFRFDWQRRENFAGGHHHRVAAGNEFGENRRSHAGSRLSAELQQRLFAPEKLDSNLPDGRVHARESRLRDERAQPGLFPSARLDSGSGGRDSEITIKLEFCGSITG